MWAPVKSVLSAIPVFRDYSFPSAGSLVDALGTASRVLGSTCWESSASRREFKGQSDRLLEGSNGRIRLFDLGASSPGGDRVTGGVVDCVDVCPSVERMRRWIF